MGLAVWLTFAVGPLWASDDDQLVMTVGSIPYNHRQLFGISATDLRSRFDSEVKAYTDQALLAELDRMGYFHRHPEMKLKLGTRPALEGAVFDSAYQGMLDFACRRLLLAHVTDEILRRHRVRIAEYVNLDVLGAALSNQIGLLEFLYDHKTDPASQNDPLYAEADEKFGLAVPKEGWGDLRDILRARPGWMRWTVVALRRSEDVNRYALRALLAHYLLQQACEEGGVYYERAKAEMQFDNSEVYRVHVSGYVGNSQVLQEYLNNVIDQDGDVALQGVLRLQTWFAGAGTATRMGVDRAIGGSLVPGNSSPTIGVLSRLSPDAFEVLGWARKRERDGTTDTERKALAVFWQVNAYKMAVADFLPEVHSAIAGWQPNVELLGEAVSVDGRDLVMPEVKVGDFIRRPYPGKPFKEFEQQKAAIQELAVRAALAVQTRDSKAADELQAELGRRGQSAETQAVRAAYEALAERLHKELARGPQVGPSPTPR
jgi:hypothetical protein